VIIIKNEIPAQIKSLVFLKEYVTAKMMDARTIVVISVNHSGVFIF